ncbi:MAG: hypothetical protein QF645_05915 [Planctomycetota bacterium]|nr:hypothetical protein [Planctomycetota bacterium]
MSVEKIESAPHRLDHAWGHLTRAEMGMASGNFLRAMEDLNEALGLEPQFTEALITRGYLRFLQKDLRGSLRDMNAANEISGEKMEIISYLEKIHQRVSAPSEMLSSK